MKIVDRHYDFKIALVKEDTKKFMDSVVCGVSNMKVRSVYNNILFCAQIKSGSLHIFHLLSDALGYDKHEIGFNLRGLSLYYPRMLAAKYTRKNTISHCHEHFTLDLVGLIDTLDLKLLVNTRNLLDSLVSRYDTIQDRGFWNDLVSPTGRDKYHNSDTEYQLDVIIELYASDHINFYTGWEQYEGNVMRTTYKEMVADEVGLVGRVADWLGADVIGDVGGISKDIKEAGGINFNKGIAGRGAKLFSERQKEDIRYKADILGCEDKEFLGGL